MRSNHLPQGPTDHETEKSFAGKKKSVKFGMKIPPAAASQEFCRNTMSAFLYENL